MKILFLNGSPDKNGNTFYLLSEIKKEIEENDKNIETKIMNVAKGVTSAKWPFCINCSSPCDRKCYLNTYLNEIYDEMIKADCIIFGSPVYFGGMSGQMKVLFDKTRYLRANKLLIGKPGGVVTVGGGKYGGQELTAGDIINSMQVNGMTVFNNGFSGIDAGHKGVLAMAPASEDENAKTIIKNFAKRAILEGKKYSLIKEI